MMLARRSGARSTLARPAPAAGPVHLPDLMARLPALPPLTAVLGLADNGRPLLLNLGAPEVANLLIAGDASAGKSQLLRSCLLSLAMRSGQGRLQVGLVDFQEPGRRLPDDTLQPLYYLPHLVARPAVDVAGSAHLLANLLDEVEHRLEQRIKRPLLLVAIDNVDALLEYGGHPVQMLLPALLQRGPQAGIQLILAGRSPAEPAFRQLLRGSLSIRLVGSVASAAEARAASGRPESLAHYLRPPGDFVAATAETLVYFQAATISDYHLHLSLDKMYRSRLTAVLSSSGR